MKQALLQGSNIFYSTISTSKPDITVRESEHEVKSKVLKPASNNIHIKIREITTGKSYQKPKKIYKIRRES